MSGRRKMIAVFSSGLTGRYKCSLCRVLNIAAEDLGVNLVYFNSYGKLRSINTVIAQEDMAEAVDVVIELG